MRRIINKTTMLYTLYSIVTLLFFIWYLFPSDFVADFIEKSVQARGQGLLLEVETVKPSFPAGIKLTGLTIQTPAMGTVPIDYFTANIDVFSMIKRQPVISFSTDVFGGTIKGKIKISKQDLKKSTFDSFVIEGVDLSKCSEIFAKSLSGFKLSGVVDGEGSYVMDGRGHGNVSLTVKQFIVQPEKPMLTLKNLSFTEITTAIELKSKRIQIESCEIDGNEFDGNLKGSVIVKYPYNKSVLRLSGKFKPEKEFAEKMPLELLFKKKVKYGDEVSFRISGTVKKPRVR